jgi:2-methylfumaryl-CoA isomerase
MVAALTCQQFADLVTITRLGQTFAFLERLLRADFSSSDDLYTYRDTIAVLLAPWFARRTVADLTAALADTSVAWALLHNRSDAPGSRR